MQKLIYHLKKKLIDFQVGKNALLPLGTQITVRHFLPGQYIDISGKTKGKGFQGVVKRYKFKGQPKTHGHTKNERKRGTVGSGKSRVWKGKRMAGRMGYQNFTVESARIFRIDPKQNLIFVEGHVPGAPSWYVTIRDAWWKPPSSPPFPTFFPISRRKRITFFTTIFTW